MEIKRKEFVSKANAFSKEMENNIVSAMKAQDVKAISFFNNGDNSGFDIDKAYASLTVDDEIKYGEIVLVVENNGHLYIALEDMNSNNTELSIIENGEIYSTKAWESLSKQLGGGLNVVSLNRELGGGVNVVSVIDETFHPLSTLLELVDSVKEVLEDALGGESIKGYDCGICLC